MLEPIRSLEELGDVIVRVEVTRPDGKIVTVEMRALTEEELFGLRRSMHWPKPPIKDMTKRGPVYDYGDEGYLAAMEDANLLLAQKSLVAMLTFDIPGGTPDEKAANLGRKIGGYAFNRLVREATRINSIGLEEVAAAADSFLDSGDGRLSGDAPVEADPAPVAPPIQDRAA